MLFRSHRLRGDGLRRCEVVRRDRVVEARRQLPAELVGGLEQLRRANVGGHRRRRTRRPDQRMIRLGERAELSAPDGGLDPLITVQEAERDPAAVGRDVFDASNLSGARRGIGWDGGTL